MKSEFEIEEIVSRISVGPWQIRVGTSGTRPYLQISDPHGVCNVTGQLQPWKGRKWFLSQWMTETEIVKTALKAYLSAAEHEALETFKYRGLSVFDPHIRVEDLITLRLTNPLDKRE